MTDARDQRSTASNPIVVAVDGSAGSERAVRWCAEMAPRLDAEVVAVHAISIPFEGLSSLEVPANPVVDEQWHRDLETTLADEWCEPLADLPHRSQVVEGHPAHVIVAVAREEDASMIVAGSRGRGGFSELLLGSVSHQLTHHADRPVVIIPPPER